MVAAGFSLCKLRTLPPKGDCPPLAEKGAATFSATASKKGGDRQTEQNNNWKNSLIFQNDTLFL